MTIDLTDDTVRRLEWLRACRWITGWNLVDGGDGVELHVHNFDGVNGMMCLTSAEAREWLAGYTAGVQRAS